MHVTFQKFCWCISLTNVLDSTLDFAIHIGFYFSRTFQILGLFSQAEKWEKGPNLVVLFERATSAFNKPFISAVTL